MINPIYIEWKKENEFQLVLEEMKLLFITKNRC